jgi:N-methylhydantoinase B
MPIDKVTLEILASHCRAATENMAYTLYRTAHSTFVKETEDFTIGLLTPEGKTFAIPLDLGATWFPGLDYGGAIGMVPGGYADGDIAVTNDPYSGYVSTHTPDLHMWKPVFHEGELAAFTCGHIHNTDIGGAVPASLSRSLVEIHQEGIRLTPCKLYKAGELNEELLQVLLTNVRQPEQNWGDLKAFVGAMNTGARKVREMIAKFGIETFREGVEDLMDYAEHQAREIVRAMPDGEYFFSDYTDEDSDSARNPCRLALNLKIDGDSAVLDFTGSDPQLTSSINVPTGGHPHHTLMLVGVYYVLYTLNPNILLNIGLTRPFTCILPEGTVVNPRFPAAVGMRSLTCGRLRSLVFGAFGLVLPDRMPAAPAGSSSIVNVMTTDNRSGKPIIAAIDPVVGGAGGMPHADGPDGSGADAAYLKNTPVELIEAEVPIEIIRYGLAPDTAGAGKHRGGLGTLLEFKVFSPNTRITARNRDRTRFRPWGILGGRAGEPSNFILNPGTPKERILGNTDTLTAEPGDVLHFHGPGGGGRGHPWEREPERVLADVERGYVSVGAAAESYGVVIADGAVDAAATEARRAAMQSAAAGEAHFSFGPEREAFERVWTRANYDALTDILAGIPVHWRFFVKGRIFDAMDEAAADDGSTVRAAFERILEDHPQIRG